MQTQVLNFSVVDHMNSSIEVLFICLSIMKRNLKSLNVKQLHCFLCDSCI